MIFDLTATVHVSSLYKVCDPSGTHRYLSLHELVCTKFVIQVALTDTCLCELVSSLLCDDAVSSVASHVVEFFMQYDLRFHSAVHASSSV